MNDDTCPNVIAIEFGNEIDQRTVNYVTSSDTFMPDSVYKILQHAPDIYGNPYKEYFDIFKTVWHINQALTKEKKIQIRLLDPAGIQDSFSKISSSKNKDRDLSMFDKLRWDIINLYSMQDKLTRKNKLEVQNLTRKINIIIIPVPVF